MNILYVIITGSCTVSVSENRVKIISFDRKRTTICKDKDWIDLEQ